MKVYFAYGSNMLTKQLQERAPSAKIIDRATIDDWLVVFNKRGENGSGKANLLSAPGSVTWGVLFEISEKDLNKLDKCEKGYKRKTEQVQMTNGEKINAETYFSEDLTDNPVALNSYKKLIIDGAREHNLPDDYIKYLEQLPSRED